MSKLYSVRIVIEGKMIDIQYANWNVIANHKDALSYGMDTFLFNKEEARKLCMHLMLVHPIEQKGSWLSLNLCKHSRYHPYPCMEVVETFNI